MHRTRSVFFFFLCILSLFSYGDLQCNIQVVTLPKCKLKDSLLPEDHPLQKELEHLFKDAGMFDSPQNLRQAGFVVFERVNRGLMVASYPGIKNYLFKKFKNGVPQKKQLESYLNRINGATALSEFIHLNQLNHIVTPKKWLYRLPKNFSDPETGKRTYILIVEKIDICSGWKEFDGEVAKRYSNMDFNILRELCTVVYYFRGLDSEIHNMPFTYRNKIAFIDTERWNWNRTGFLDRVMKYLSQDRQEFALEVFEEISKQDNR